MTKKAKLRGQADKLWYIHNKGERCEICGLRGIIQVHHFYYKRNYPHLRYDDDNAINLCKACHFLLHFGGNPDIQERIIDSRGKKWYNRLKERAFTNKKPSYQTIGWYEKNIERLQADEKM